MDFINHGERHRDMEAAAAKLDPPPSPAFSAHFALGTKITHICPQNCAENNPVRHFVECLHCNLMKCLHFVINFPFHCVLILSSLFLSLHTN